MSHGLIKERVHKTAKHVGMSLSECCQSIAAEIGLEIYLYLQSYMKSADNPDLQVKGECMS